MSKAFLIIIFSLFSYCVSAQQKEGLLRQLDSVLTHRQQAMAEKEKRISYLKTNLSREHNSKTQLNIYSQIYDEYYVYQFDSAHVYVNRAIELALRLNDQYYYSLFVIRKAQLMAIGGLYFEARNLIESINSKTLDENLQFDYYLCLFRIYSYWSDYCNDKEYKPVYRCAANGYLSTAIVHLNKNNEAYDYFMGEFYVYVNFDPKTARKYYLSAVKTCPKNSRLYAMACFALAGNYRNDNDEQQYEKYLILSALSDAQNLTMENFSLQMLASYIFETDESNIEHAQNYINQSLADAKFYNSKLRIIEISERLPGIISKYDEAVKSRNSLQKLVIISVSILLIILLGALVFIFKQNSKLTARRKELSKRNMQLSELNEQQKMLNKQLNTLNERLVDTNKKREGLAKIYIDLCAKYINRLKNQKTLVQRKIKANQVNELLTLITSSKFSEEDAVTFLNRFDKAFLDLYPTFVEEFNSLLKPEEQIEVKASNTMTTELRIFALIRLGVSESSEIADLLFYSPQTIYNYRSNTKNRAIDRDNFENDVMNLCTVIRGIDVV